MINHLLLIPLAYKRYGAVLLFLSAIFLISVYAFKAPTYDLLVYTDNILNSDYVYEPVSNFFLSLVEIFSFGVSWLYPIIITLLLLTLHVVGLINLQSNTEKRYRGFTQILLASSVASLSLYFFLGSQNVLRQCISIGFFILFFASYEKKNYFTSIAFLILSAFGHYGNIPIIFLMSLYIIVINNTSLIKSLSIGMILGAVGVLGLRFFVGSIDYLIADFAFSEERSSLSVKFAAIFALVVITTILIDTRMRLGSKLIASILGLRFLLLGLLISIFLFDLSEMFTRVAVNLYALDMILVFCLLSTKTRLNYNSRHSIALLILSSAFAPNVFQILSAS